MNVKKYFAAAWSNPLSVPWKVFNVIRRRLLVDCWFLNGWSFPPEMITILITKRCNFSCAGCSSASPEYTKNFKGNELKTDEFKEIIDKVSWFKPGIYFCGGEPTLREDLYELIKYAKSKGLVTAFTTNGSLLSNENIKKILFSGVDFVSASLDGAPKHHNSYRGYEKAYEKLTRGVEELIEQRRCLKLKSPNVRITCIINPEDKKDAFFVLKKAKEMGVDEVAFGNFMFYPSSYKLKQKKFITGSGVGGLGLVGLEVKGNKLPFSLDQDGFDRIYNELKLRSELPLSFVPRKIDLKKFFSFQDPSLGSRCLSPWFVATVLPDGTLSACQEYRLGNLRKASFMALWNGQGMKKFRRLRKKGVFPACFRCIEGQEIRFD